MTEFKSLRQSLIILMVVFAMFISASYTVSIKDKPLLIQFGQTTPDARLLRKNVAYWEAYLPFDDMQVAMAELAILVYPRMSGV